MRCFLNGGWHRFRTYSSHLAPFLVSVPRFRPAPFSVRLRRVSDASISAKQAGAQGADQRDVPPLSKPSAKI